jgi:hypothetical protein
MTAERKLVSFFGLGSGTATSLLYSYIKAHPKICVPEREVDFFSDTKAYSQGIDWYESSYKQCGKGFIYGDLAQNYLKSAQVVSLITRTYPSAKLFAVIEDPLVSVRMAYIEAGRNRTISPGLSLAMFLKKNPEVLTSALHGRQLVQYFSFYAQTDLLVVTASDVRDNSLSVIAKVYEHIGVDAKFVPLVLKHLVPEDEEVRRPGIIKRTRKALRKMIVTTYRNVSKKINPPKVPLETLAVAARQLSLSPELETYLKNYYRKDVILLSNLLHRNLSVEWGMEKD